MVQKETSIYRSNGAADKISVKIGGMTCAACVRTVEKSLKQVNGVFEVNVNLATEKALVSYDPGITRVGEIKKTIEQAGYNYLGAEGELSREAENSEREKDLNKKRNRFLAGFIAGIILMMPGMLPRSLPAGLPLSYLMLLFSFPVFVYVSYPVFRAAFNSIRHGNLDMDVMYSMGIGTAFLSSVMGTFHIILTEEFMFYDSAVMLAAFLTLGRYLENRARGKTSEAIQKLMGMQPKTAFREEDSVMKEVPVEAIGPGDILFVKPGGRVPVDGTVVDGESFVDEAMLTGESLPVAKRTGDPVTGGTINKNSVIKFRAVKIGKDMVLSQIIRMVEEAQGSKPPVQRIADRIVTWFIPVIIFLSILSFVVWFAVLGKPLLFALTTLISILVIACPCALGLATPTAVTVGIGRGAELGVLIKNGEALEKSEKITTVIFDKTGTLTRGKPEVTDIIAMESSREELLAWTAGVEQYSQHPIAQAVVNRAETEGIALLECGDLDTLEGKGISAKVGDSIVLIGNRNLFQERGVSIPSVMGDTIARLEGEGKTVILASKNGAFAGILAVADTLKETAVRAVEEMKKMGLRVVMITGDNRTTATSIAAQAGIEDVLFEVLPHEKANEVKGLQDKGEVVAFVGDGINDAPALARADIGIAIGSGTDVAIEAGDIVLVRDDLVDAVASLQLSRKVMARIRQNLFWALAYNAALIPVAAGLLSTWGVTMKPELAGFAMAMSSVTVVTLSLMLKKYVPGVRQTG